MEVSNFSKHQIKVYNVYFVETIHCSKMKLFKLSTIFTEISSNARKSHCKSRFILLSHSSVLKSFLLLEINVFITVEICLAIVYNSDFFHQDLPSFVAVATVSNHQLAIVMLLCFVRKYYSQLF